MHPSLHWRILWQPLAWARLPLSVATPLHFRLKLYFFEQVSQSMVLDPMRIKDEEAGTCANNDLRAMFGISALTTQCSLPR